MTEELWLKIIEACDNGDWETVDNTLNELNSVDIKFAYDIALNLHKSFEAHL